MSKEVTKEASKYPLIFSKIPKIMSAVGAIGKDSKNAQQGYSYRGIDAVYNALNAVMSEHEVFSTCISIEDENTGERQSKSGSALFEYSATFVYRFYATDGSYVDHKSKGKGMDSGDKDTNKAMSVAHKYALLQIFAIPTDEPKDPEIDDHEVKPVEVKKEQAQIDMSIKLLNAYRTKIENIKTMEELDELRASFIEYKKGSKNVFNGRQEEILEKAMGDKFSKLQEAIIDPKK